MANAVPFVEGRLKRNQIVVFSKTYSPEGRICENILKEYDRYLPGDTFEWVDIEKRSDCPQVEDYLWLLSGKNNREVPLLFVKRRCMGGYDEIMQMHNDGRLARLLKNLTLSDDEADEDSVQGKDFDAGQIIVRIEELDETELLIRVADSISDINYHADYNVPLEKTSMTEIHEMFKQEREERGHAVDTPVMGKCFIPKVPVWLPVVGSHGKLTISMILSTETARFIMTKPVQTEVKDEGGSTVTAHENNVVSIQENESSHNFASM